MALLHLEKFPKTADLFTAVNIEFEKGVGIVHLVTDDRICGVIVAPETAKEMLARRIADRWLEDPSIFEDLKAKSEESPETWD